MKAGRENSPGARLPRSRLVDEFLETAIGTLFPDHCTMSGGREDTVDAGRAFIRAALPELAQNFIPADRVDALIDHLDHVLGEVYENVVCDARAIFEGDPAAESVEEVVAAYPGFFAIATHRLAHEIFGQGIPVLPRLLSEGAHRRTGIDIHPGATIGRCFAIDHGTGIVIGETAVIGEKVKLYQGVTLGALSVAKSAKGKKRHPTIEDRVVLYAHATVLGGETVIGHDSVVGGNVWITSSVAPNSYIYHTNQVRVRRASDLLDATDYSI